MRVGCVRVCGTCDIDMWSFQAKSTQLLTPIVGLLHIELQNSSPHSLMVVSVGSPDYSVCGSVCPMF